MNNGRCHCNDTNYLMLCNCQRIITVVLFMDIASHNATNATSSPHATIMHCSRQATCVSIMPIMDVANNVNDSIYQDGERMSNEIYQDGELMSNELLRSNRLASYGGRSDNDTDIDWYSDKVYGTYIQIVNSIGSYLDDQQSIG